MSLFWTRTVWSGRAVCYKSTPTIIAVEILRSASRKLILREQPFLHIICASGFRHQHIFVCSLFIHFLKLVKKPVWRDLDGGSAEFCRTKKNVNCLTAKSFEGFGLDWLSWASWTCLYLAEFCRTKKNHKCVNWFIFEGFGLSLASWALSILDLDWLLCQMLGLAWIGFN